MKWWKQKRREPPAAVVQVRRGEGQPFGALDRYVPLRTGETALYRAIREGAVSYTHLTLPTIRLV